MVEREQCSDSPFYPCLPTYPFAVANTIRTIFKIDTGSIISIKNLGGFDKNLFVIMRQLGRKIFNRM